jgi:hypothetical protein
MRKTTVAVVERIVRRQHERQLYASTFTPDGILDYGEGDVKGREAIIKVIGGMPRAGSTRAIATRPGSRYLQDAASVVTDVTSRCGVPGASSAVPRHSDFPAT